MLIAWVLVPDSGSHRSCTLEISRGAFTLQFKALAQDGEVRLCRWDCDIRTGGSTSREEEQAVCKVTTKEQELKGNSVKVMGNVASPL